MFSLSRRQPSMMARATAALAIGLVLALTVFAANPELHERLHGHHAGAAAAASHGGQLDASVKADESDDGCVVTLFAQGVVLALALLSLAFTGQTIRLSDFAHVDRVIPDAPRYLRLPTQAPPLA
jgi:hypothetical protein